MTTGSHPYNYLMADSVSFWHGRVWDSHTNINLQDLSAIDLRTLFWGVHRTDDDVGAVVVAHSIVSASYRK